MRTAVFRASPGRLATLERGIVNNFALDNVQEGYKDGIFEQILWPKQ